MQDDAASGDPRVRGEPQPRRTAGPAPGRPSHMTRKADNLHMAKAITDRRLRAFVLPVGNPHVRTPSAPFCAHEVIGRIALIASGSRMDSRGWLAAHDVTALVVQA